MSQIKELLNGSEIRIHRNTKRHNLYVLNAKNLLCKWIMLAIPKDESEKPWLHFCNTKAIATERMIEQMQRDYDTEIFAAMP